MGKPGEKAFIYCTSLQVHKRIHTGEKLSEGQECKKLSEPPVVLRNIKQLTVERHHMHVSNVRKSSAVPSTLNYMKVLILVNMLF